MFHTSVLLHTDGHYSMGSVCKTPAPREALEAAPISTSKNVGNRLPRKRSRNGGYPDRRYDTAKHLYAPSIGIADAQRTGSDTLAHIPARVRYLWIHYKLFAAELHRIGDNSDLIYNKA